MLEIAIVGAGPYGLSIAAHFRARGIPFRIFGPPMDSWLTHMPKGMMLKSDGFASNLYDPSGSFTLKKFCSEKGIEYSDLSLPVRLETFSAYGLAFKDRLVPELDERMVVSLDRVSDGFRLELADGEKLNARRVILAVGITHFDYVPETLSHLSSEFVTHSYRHQNLEPFKGRSVAVLGGGASAIGLVGLLKEIGAQPTLIARQKTLEFHDMLPVDKPRSLWERVRRPQSGLGPGLKSRFFADAPQWFHYLPEFLRIEAVRRSLGPAGHWYSRDKVVGQLPLLLGCEMKCAVASDQKVKLTIQNADGTQQEVITEHVIAGTGYKVDIDRLKFLSHEIRSRVKTVSKTPVLSSNFESSIPGLYFVGIAAANSFGPVMRFAFGANFAARTLTKTVSHALSSSRASVSVPGVVTTAK
jgi:thioredoxin reductase